MRQVKHRDRVTAEITTFHVMRLADEQGWNVSHQQAVGILNQERAQEMWQQMMQAGLDFVMHTLSGQSRPAENPHDPK